MSFGSWWLWYVVENGVWEGSLWNIWGKYVRRRDFAHWQKKSFTGKKDGFKTFNPHASEFNPFQFSSGTYCFFVFFWKRQKKWSSLYDFLISPTGLPTFSSRSSIRKQTSSSQENKKKFDVVPLGDIPPGLVKHLEMRNPSGFVYTIPESDQTVEFWEGVKNKPLSSINLLEEMETKMP